MDNPASLWPSSNAPRIVDGDKRHRWRLYNRLVAKGMPGPHLTIIVKAPRHTDQIRHDPVLYGAAKLAASWQAASYDVVSLFSQRVNQIADLRRILELDEALGRANEIAAANLKTILASAELSTQSGGRVLAAWGDLAGDSVRDLFLRAKFAKQALTVRSALEESGHTLGYFAARGDKPVLAGDEAARNFVPRTADFIPAYPVWFPLPSFESAPGESAPGEPAPGELAPSAVSTRDAGKTNAAFATPPARSAAAE